MELHPSGQREIGQAVRDVGGRHREAAFECSSVSTAVAALSIGTRP